MEKQLKKLTKSQKKQTKTGPINSSQVETSCAKTNKQKSTKQAASASTPKAKTKNDGAKAIKKIDKGGPTDLSRKENEFLQKLKQKTVNSYSVTIADNKLSDNLDVSTGGIVLLDSSIDADVDLTFDVEKENEQSSSACQNVQSLLQKAEAIMQEPVPADPHIIFDSPHMTISKQKIPAKSKTHVSLTQTLPTTTTNSTSELKPPNNMQLNSKGYPTTGGKAPRKRFAGTQSSNSEKTCTPAKKSASKKSTAVDNDYCGMCRTYKIQLYAMDRKLVEKNKEIEKLQEIIKNGEYEGKLHLS